MDWIKSLFSSQRKRKEEIHIRNALTAITVVLAIYLTVANRYRVINRVFKYPFLRRLVIHFALKIPFVRNKLSGIVFHQNQIPSVE
ncbi:hypothetical protein MKX54_07885 [Alkalihalobacillus sp. FSL R5-0424]